MTDSTVPKGSNRHHWGLSLTSVFPGSAGMATADSGYRHSLDSKGKQLASAGSDRACGSVCSQREAASVMENFEFISTLATIIATVAVSGLASRSIDRVD